MSYDLTVYAPVALSAEKIAALVREIPTLDVEDPTSARHTVVRGKRRASCFSLEAPVEADPGDVPAEVTAAVVGVSVQYDILVEGSSATSVPVARRFAKRLAAATEGASYDHQTEIIWSQAGSREAERPSMTERIDVIEVHWYLPPQPPQEVAAAWLAAARTFLPEILPKRFGEYEPLAGKLEHGDAGFVDAADGTDSLFFTGRFPALGGSFSTRDYDGSLRRVGSVGVTLDRATFHHPRWRSALEGFFGDFARRTGSFYATAEVARNIGWSGRSVWYDGNEESVPALAGANGWVGLSPYPVWWTWFDGAYLEAVSPWLNLSVPAGTGAVTESGSGRFHPFAVEPTDREELAAALSRGVTVGSTRPWSPEHLTATLLPKRPGDYLQPIEPAVWRPSDLVSPGHL